MLNAKFQHSFRTDSVQWKSDIMASLQTVADLLKLIQKEDITSRKSRSLFISGGPIVIFAMCICRLCGITAITIVDRMLACSSALFFLLAIVSLDVIGIVMAGWSSNNKYSMLGTMRSAAQIISYEVPLGLSVIMRMHGLSVVGSSGNFLSAKYSWREPQYLFGIRTLGIETDRYRWIPDLECFQNATFVFCMDNFFYCFAG